LNNSCLLSDVLRHELGERRRLIAESDDFACLAPFASGYPFEACVFPKVHSSAFSRISAVQIENLAKILRAVLQKLDHTLGGPPNNLSLQDRPFLRPREGYWKTIEEDFHWHLEILPQLIGLTGFERASWFFYTSVPPETAARCLSC
jgi:UDPglucose--hexose-1-phosphate uridylyltransferase